MTRSVRRLARLALLAVVCSCATGPLSVHAGGMLAAPTVAVAAGRLTLRVSPARVVLGQRFTVLLVGAQPRVVYTFVMAPRHAQGFGGGLMGRYRADGHGLVHFSYPGPTGRWEIGQWRLSATPPATGSHLIGATTVFVVTATVATHLANSPDPLPRLV